MSTDATGKVVHITRLSRTVRDLPAALAFYCEVVGCEIAGASEHDDPTWRDLMGSGLGRAQSVLLRLGEQQLELLAFEAAGQCSPADCAATDFCFQHAALVVNDIDRAYTWLQRHNVRAISNGPPQHLPPTAGGVSAFKFRDPEGHPLELLFFPPGIGYRGWQQPDRLFSGIDHCAIVISNLPRSLYFYKQLLGFTIAARGLNQGKAQDRLDDASDVLVDVIALHAASQLPHAPHLELLHYRRPAARIWQPGTSNPIGSDCLVVRVVHLDAMAARLRAAHIVFISSGIVSCTDQVRRLHVRDPDGHALLLEEVQPLHGMQMCSKYRMH